MIPHLDGVIEKNVELGSQGSDIFNNFEKLFLSIEDKIAKIKSGEIKNDESAKPKEEAPKEES